MLVAFLKHPSETAVRCRVIKFVDRIYAMPRLVGSGVGLVVVRSVCLEVLPESPAELYRVGMVTPCAIAKIQDYSPYLEYSSPLTMHATDFRVVSAERRIVRWDGIDNVRVAPQLDITQAATGAACYVEIQLSESVEPGQRLAFALRLDTKVKLERLSFFRRELRVRYFSGSIELPAHLSFITPEREIPVASYYSGDPKQARVAGGFDVVACYPRKVKASASAPATTGIVSYSPTTAKLSRPMTSSMWRLRNIVNDQEVSTTTRQIVLALDMEIPSTFPMYVLGVVTSVTVTLLLTLFLVPWLRLKLGM